MQIDEVEFKPKFVRKSERSGASRLKRDFKKKMNLKPTR